MKKILFACFCLICVGDILAAVSSEEYLNLLYDSSALYFAKQNKELEIPKGKIDIWNSESKTFKAIPVSEALPLIMTLLERGEITNRVESLGDGQTFENKALSFADRRAFLLTQLCFGFDSLGTIAFPWLSGKGNDLTIPSALFHYYWWYEGRKYMPNIWAEWYACWQEESKKEAPRALVLDQLASEITGLGYHVFPYLASALENDKTLEKLVEVYKTPGRGNWRFSDFNKWYTENGEKFSLPECETLDTAKKRFDINILPIQESVIEMMNKWQSNAKRYYAENTKNSNYWYYKLNAKDDITEEDIFQAKYGE
ncbi:hypothetical protein IKS73_03205 [bacterium]|nr:hypothetical protein [bacterium]